MGFFKDFKRDFAQAVNELMPDKDELGAEYDDEDMVNTFDENDQMEVAPEDLLENLDEIRIDRPEPEMPEASENLEHFSNVETTEKDKTSDETSVFDTVPEAEVIQDELEMEPEPFSEDELEPKPDTEYLQAETVTEAGAEIKEDTADETDELKALDALDEENMLEHTEEALLTEPETETKQEELQNFLTADLEKAVEDTLAKQAEEETQMENERVQEDAAMETTPEDGMASSFASRSTSRFLLSAVLRASSIIALDLSSALPTVALYLDCWMPVATNQTITATITAVTAAVIIIGTTGAPPL